MIKLLMGYGCFRNYLHKKSKAESHDLMYCPGARIPQSKPSLPAAGGTLDAGY